MNSQQTQSYTQWLETAEKHFKNGDASVAKKIYFQILNQVPDDTEVRELFRAVTRSQDFVDSSLFVDSFESAYMNNASHYIDLASRGWRILNGFDRHFIEETLEKGKSAPSSNKENQVNDDCLRINGSLIDELLKIKKIEKRWEEAKKIVNSDDPRVVQDDYKGIPEEQLREQLILDQSGDGLNITIIGGGCTGLALANYLKVSLRDKINILIIESRIEAPHTKKNYERDWLMDITVASIKHYIDPKVLKILNDFGEGQEIGAYIALFETLLLLSCRELGVRFLYRKDNDFSFLKESQTHMIFDATGGRYVPPKENLKVGETKPDVDQFDFKLAYNGMYPQTYSKYGVNNFYGEPADVLQLTRQGNYFTPSKQGKLCKAALTKLTHVPVGLHSALLSYIEDKNDDNLFYIWKGKQKKKINELLILINLDKKAYEFLSEFVGSKKTLKQFIDAGGLNPEYIDERLINVIKFVVESDDAGVLANIEPPFIYEPYVRLMGGTLDRLYGRLLVPIGDSVYNGHPKVGNGLGAHLNSIANIHDLFLFLYGRTANDR